MRVTRLYIKGDNQKGYVGRVDLQENLGIVGNAKGKGANRQVAIFSEEGRRAIEEMENPGLCTRRFQENITISDLKVQELKPGDQVQIGGALLEITGRGKRCFSDCPLVQSRQRCPLTKGILYARVLQRGTIRRGDSVSRK